MRYLVSIIGFVAALALLKYREQVGNMLGEAEWMNKLGGVYNIVIIVAVLVFFWSVAFLTGTEGIFLWPIIFVLTGGRGAGGNTTNEPGFYIE